MTSLLSNEQLSFLREIGRKPNDDITPWLTLWGIHKESHELAHKQWQIYATTIIQREREDPFMGFLIHKGIRK